MFIYNLVVLLYGLVIRIASVSKPKARQWVEGRRNWKEKLKQGSLQLGNPDRVWVHCASYGEFEQGRPIIDEIRLRHPGKKIVLSFFSPSGYEAFKDWKGADLVCYLPLDTASNARDFMDIVQPGTVIFIKYEFWLNFLKELKARSISTYLVSAVFKPHHPFFKWYGGIFRRSLSTFNMLFIQDRNSASLLEEIGVKDVLVCGDTRFDRVMDVKKNRKDIPLVKQFITGAKVIVAGSTWPGDNEFLLKAFLKMGDDKKLIVAPHEVDRDSISALEEQLRSKNISYSLYTSQNISGDSRVLVVDTIGLLSSLYYYGNAAYIGGGFNDGWHNTLEAAVYQVPVALYGKDEGRFNEISELIQLGAVKNVFNEAELLAWVKKYLDSDTATAAIKNALQIYFDERGNVTQRVMARMVI